MLLVYNILYVAFAAMFGNLIGILLRVFDCNVQMNRTPLHFATSVEFAESLLEEISKCIDVPDFKKRFVAQISQVRKGSLHCALSVKC